MIAPSCPSVNVNRSPADPTPEKPVGTAPTKGQIEACPDKPPYPIINLDNIPEDLRGHRQWVLWFWCWHPTRKKWTKVPYHIVPYGPPEDRKPSFQKASANDPETWHTFD